jgi:threonine dehydratase
MITYHDVARAYEIVQPVVHKTPLLRSRTLNGIIGNDVFFKGEHFQRVGAFKIRGAYYKISSLTEEERRRGIVAHSSGNHAQGVALAAKLLGVRATVVMPKTSPPIKVRATKEYGADVLFCEDSSDAREAMAQQLQREHGYILVPPYDDDFIIAGQGTVGIEVAQDLPSVEYLFVPVGGGGLIAGSAVAIKHLVSSVKVIGVETEPANDCSQSFQKKEIVRIPPPNTIADGIRTQSIGQRNFELIMKYVDDMVTVKDEQVVETLRFFLERMKIVVEPTGAVAPAAVYHNVLGLSGKRICAVISGGNIDPALLKSLL